MVGPTVSFFRGTTARMAVCATPATIQSDIYGAAFRMIGKEITSIAIPDLAGAVEFGTSQEAMEEMIRNAFRGNNGTFEVLILGCTHYPFATAAFRKVLGDSVVLIDPADAVAERARTLFWPQEVGDSKTQFCISRESLRFRDLVAELFPYQEYSIEVVSG